MDRVYLLEHLRLRADGEDDGKLIGVYSTREAAQAAQSRALQLPGFRDHPDGFTIAEYLLDEDNWTSGFGPSNPSDDD